MNLFKNGTLIALAAASLVAPACKKDKAKTEPTPTEGAQPAADEKTAPAAGETQPAATETTPAAGEKTAMIHCEGVNDCKGKGGCKSAKNDCKGKNACKGKSFAEMTEEDCKAKGGTVAAAN